MYAKVILFLSALSLLACQGAPKLAGFDANLWDADPLACSGYRAEHVQILMENQEKLIGLSINRMNTWLGLPDRTRLYERGQKFYVYFVEAGGQCPDSGEGAEGEAIIFRFSAVGKLKEIELRQP